MRPRSNPWSLIALLAFLLLFADLAFGSSGAPGPLAQSPLEEFSFSSPDQVEDYVAQAVRAARKEQPKGDGGSVLAPGSPMFKSAEDSARRRLLYSERPSLYQKKQDLLGGVRASIMQLAGEAGDQAGDPEDPSSSSSASHAETADGQDHAHDHVAVLAAASFRFGAVKLALLQRYGLASHWSCTHTGYWSAVRYCCMPSPKKPKAALR